MWSDVRDLDEFYRTPAGAMARRLIRQRLRALWPAVKGERVLGFGYAVPYLGLFDGEAERVIGLMPAEQGVLRWPAHAPNLTALAEETFWPLPDRSIDRVLLVHAVESSEALRAMLREIWRVLTDSGKLLVVAPNRASLWARLERTPFGHGRPFTSRQLNRLLRDAMFTPLRGDAALVLPPFRSRLILSAAPAWDRYGRRVLGAVAGVTIAEAGKQLYAATAVPVRQRRLRGLEAPVLARPAARGSPMPGPRPLRPMSRRS